MLILKPLQLQQFTINDVFDIDELGDNSRVSQRFPNYAAHNTYKIRSPISQHEPVTGLLSRFAIKRMGAITIGSVQSPLAMNVGIDGDGMHRLFLTFSCSGGIMLQTARGGEAISQGTTGLVYRGLPGTLLATTHNSSRVTIQVDEERLIRTMSSLLDEFCSECPLFEPSVNWANPSAAPIARMIQRLIDEVGDPTGLCSVATAFESYTDALVHLILARLPHSRSERLHTPCSPAIPRQLRRAEEFMMAHAEQPISIADIASAAGCGARALQLAFRRFRDTTPLAALQDIRLQAIKAVLAKTNDPAVTVARQFGFSNGTRFRAIYLKWFGELPRQSLRFTDAPQI